ncbi:DUF4087 domain-containing protein [Sphingopyxis sp.]|uniref:DUF4087 domain-containing protein n=1 Tax=Sphingopyxis sp. TaxID=1908224 RepID=UPI003F6F6841
MLVLRTALLALAIGAIGHGELAEAKPAAARSEKRCGWIDNPTPANWWLTDGTGRWTIGLQGGHQAPGLNSLPDMRAKGWVATNGSYGYGCGCMQVTTDKSTARVTRIYSATPLPINRCIADKKLPRRDR